MSLHFSGISGKVGVEALVREVVQGHPLSLTLLGGHGFGALRRASAASQGFARVK